MSMSQNEAIARGRQFIDRDPIELLKLLHANIGYWGGHGFIITVSDELKKQIIDCIRFHEGSQN